jgi:hypothetical protein
MSLANKNTFFAAGSDPATVHIGKGNIYGIIATTTQTASVQTVTLYDAISSTGSVLLVLNVYLTNIRPVYFPENMPLFFSEGLTIDPGNCDVLLIYSA